jgi:FAD/FMN-containing dehydrogenase
LFTKFASGEMKMNSIIEYTSLSKLKVRIRGEVICPGDMYYDQARRVWNGRIDKYPALIVRCADITDVLNAFEFARLRGLDVTVRSGGHSMVGLAVSNGGLVIDLSGMKGIWIDPARGIAQVQAGLTLGEFVRETQALGLATTTGTVSGTGVGGAHTRWRNRLVDGQVWADHR